MALDRATLPGGWRRARFDELLVSVGRQLALDDAETYPCVGVRWYGLGAFVREAKLGASIRRKQQWVIRDGDVVYNKLFAWKGAFAIANAAVDGCIVSDKFPTYAVRCDRLEPRYLAWYFRTQALADEALSLSKGAAAISKLTLNPPQFWGLTIPLPPLHEQCRIAAELDALAAKVDEARGLCQGSARHLASVMLAARAAVFEHRLADAPSRDLGRVADVKLGKMLSPASKMGVSPRPYLRNANVQWDRFDLAQVHEMDFDEEEVSKFSLQPGDVMVCEGGDIGRAAIWGDELPGCLYQKSLHRVRCHPNAVAPRFVLHALAWGSATGRLSGLKTQTTIAHLPAVKLRRFALPCPALDQQKRIVAYLDGIQAKVDELKQLQAKTAADLDALMPSILDKAFRGEL